MTKRRAPNGAGTLYKEEAEGRRARWVSEAYVNLPDGRRVRVRGRGDSAEAAVLARVERSRAAVEAHPNAQRLTVKQLADRWVEARSPSWKAATLASYRVALDHHILPEMGTLRVAAVSSLDAQAVLTRVMRKSDGRHVSVANRSRRVMHALFAQAKRWGLIRENPVTGVEPIRRLAPPRAYWTRAQALAFLVKAERSPYRDLFHAAITTGLRSGELLALRWRDVTDDGFLVRRTYAQRTPGRVQESPKSSAAYRSVPVPAELRDRLEPRRGSPDALVFASRTGRMLNPSNVTRALRAYAEAAEVPVIQFHALRRTYASLLAEAGYHPSVIQRNLGHATPDLALRVYTSVSDALAQRAVVELSGGSFGGSVTSRAQPSDASGDAVAVVEVALDTVN